MATQDSRIKLKRSTVNSTVPTVPSSNDHTDGTWIATDIYKGELFYNQADGVLWSRDDNGVTCLGGSASLTISSADVLQLNSTPLTIVNGISGMVIVPISAILKSTYNSATYATNLGIFLRHTGSSSPITENSNKLGFTSNIINQFTLRNDTDEDQLISGANLEVFVDSGNPTAGDSDITVFVNYRLIPA